MLGARPQVNFASTSQFLFPHDCYCCHRNLATSSSVLCSSIEAKLPVVCGAKLMPKKLLGTLEISVGIALALGCGTAFAQQAPAALTEFNANNTSAALGALLGRLGPVPRLCASYGCGAFGAGFAVALRRDIRIPSRLDSSGKSYAENQPFAASNHGGV